MNACVYVYVYEKEHLLEAIPTALSTLDRLRQETRAAHAQLEAAMRIEETLKSVSDYRNLLERLYGFYLPLEQRLEALGSWSVHGVDFSLRKKTPWIEADLLALNHTRESLGTLPICAGLPRADSLDQGFGCAYVLEGATLGGRQITHLLNGSTIPEEARNYFKSYGDLVGQRWREFTAALDTFGRNGDQDQIIQGACETFMTLHAWQSGEGEPVS